MKQSNIKIAVTGGIGSGKSTVCKIINSLGYPVYSCDETYKQVLADGKTVEELSKVFGCGILNADGSLNRTALSSVVFNDENKLEKLNAITHPKIFEAMFTNSSKDSGAVFYEVPLLFEGNYQNLFDEVLVVLRDRKERIKSVMQRDGLKEEEAVKRLKLQFDYDNNDFAKYYVIHNDGKIDDLQAKINEFLLKITYGYDIKK